LSFVGSGGFEGEIPFDFEGEFFRVGQSRETLPRGG